MYVLFMLFVFLPLTFFALPIAVIVESRKLKRREDEKRKQLTSY